MPVAFVQPVRKMLRLRPAETLVDRSDLNRLSPALDAFLAGFRDCAIAPTRRLIEAYVRGQLGSLPRKSVLPMALEAGIPPRTLQELLSLHRWDDDRVRALLQKRVAERDHPPGVAVLLEAFCPKKGLRTPGVQRQAVAGRRPSNGVVFVHLAFAENGFACLLDGEVYLPAAWAGDLDRRRRAAVPDGLRYRSRAEIGLELLARARSNGVKISWTVFPSAWAETPGFLEQAGESGRFAVEATAKAPERGARLVPAAPGLQMLTNAAGATPAELLDLWRLRERTAGRMAASKAEIGHDQFEVRTWCSLKRHLILSMASLLFLAEARERAALPSSPALPLRRAR
ncbi:MAG TPA: transposase [Planctomycetota bacterium]|nr:transposase [Planctomycetota bacterium]